MTQFYSSPITNLPSGVSVQGSDVYAAVDVTETGPGYPNGALKQYTVAQLNAFFGGGFKWNLVQSSTQAMFPENGYVIDNSVIPVTLTLPLTAPVGAIIQVAGLSPGLWVVNQNSGQQILFGNRSTTLGVSGSLQSTNNTDFVNLLCVKANVLFSVIGAVGNLIYI